MTAGAGAATGALTGAALVAAAAGAAVLITYLASVFLAPLDLSKAAAILALVAANYYLISNAFLSFSA